MDHSGLSLAIPDRGGTWSHFPLVQYLADEAQHSDGLHENSCSDLCGMSCMECIRDVKNESLLFHGGQACSATANEGMTQTHLA